MRHRVGPAGHGQRPVVIVAPPRTAQCPPGGAARCQRHRQRRSENDVPFGGVAVGQLDDGLRPAQRLGHLAGLRLDTDRREGQPDRQGRLADRLDQRHGFGGQPRRLAHPAVTHVLHHQPDHAIGQRRLVPGGRAKLSQLLKEAVGDVGMDSEGVAAQPGARGDAHRGAIRIVGGQRIGDLARPLPTGPRRHNVAGGRPRRQRACASRTLRGDRLRPPGARRSTRHSRRPMPGHVLRWRRPRRRCSSARSDLSCDS